MDTVIVERGADKLLVVDSIQGELSTLSDFYQLLHQCQKDKLDKILIFHHSFSPGFFNPLTGRAEKVLSIFTTAGIRFALVATIEELHNDHFESILGLSLRFQFRVAYTQSQAEQWLINDD